MTDDRLGERLLLENERLRVWQDRVPPGGTQLLHTHRRPYLSCVVEGARGETVDAAGAVLTTVDRQPGDVRYFRIDDEPVTHRLRNTGDRTSSWSWSSCSEDDQRIPRRPAGYRWEAVRDGASPVREARVRGHGAWCR